MLPYTIGMKTRILSFVVGCCLFGTMGFAQPVPSFSPNAQLAAVQGLGKNASQDPYDPLGLNKERCNRSRKATDTVEQVELDVQEKQSVRGDMLLAILKDTRYLSTLSAQEANQLLYGFAFADNACHMQLTQTIFNHLDSVEYDEGSAEHPINIFYTLAAATLGHNYEYHRQIEDWAIERVEAAARNSAKSAVWPSLVLTSLSAQVSRTEYPYVMNERERNAFEKRIEGAIARFDSLQWEAADHYTIMDNNPLKRKNQDIVEGLLLQASSFFAAKDTDGFWKGFFTTGGFRPLVRLATANSEEEATARFSDNGETFYLSYVSPGTDGHGHFANSDNGRRHYVLSQLVQALCISYVTHGEAEGSQRIMQFTRSYLRTNHGAFVHYLHIPLSAIRSGTELLDESSLHGWELEAATLMDEMTSTLRASYRAAAVAADIHGAAEVATEWIVVGEILGGVLKVGKYAVKGADKALLRFLPAKAAARYVTVKVGGKTVIRFCKEGTKNFLQKHGWKVGAGAVGTAAVTADTHRRLAPTH